MADGRVIIVHTWVLRSQRWQAFAALCFVSRRFWLMGGLRGRQFASPALSLSPLRLMWQQWAA